MLTPVLSVALVLLATGTLCAQEEPVDTAPGSEAEAPRIDWVLTGLSTAADQLFTPSSGALFAATSGVSAESPVGLLRSDDRGDTWRPVALPPYPASPPAHPRLLAVDPTNHMILYAAGSDGLYKSSDDAANWSLIWPNEGRHVAGLAVSPADPRLVYLLMVKGLGETPAGSSDFVFLRSTDGGTTWQQLEKRQAAGCGWGADLLMPHPSDRQRAFRALACFFGGTSSIALRQTADQGQSWSDDVLSNAVDRDGAPVPNAASSFLPTRLVGGQGAAADRRYVAANRDVRVGGAAVLASPDDARSWTQVLNFPVYGQAAGADSNVALGGLAYDPSHPDTVYVAVNHFEARSHTRPSSSGVLASSDGGFTWNEFGRQDLPPIRDLALGIDARNLYAATDAGVYRMALQ
jgi:hypothetical protein